MKYVFTTEAHIFPLKTGNDLDDAEIKKPSVVIRAVNMDNYTTGGSQGNSSRTFKMRKKYKLYERGRPAADQEERKVPKLVFSSNKCTYSPKGDSARNSTPSAGLYKNHLPMKIKYFDQLFDLVGVYDNLDSLLERKTS